MNLQEVVNRGAAGIRAQGYKPSMAGDICMYRGDGGLKCIIGHCIDDDDLARKLDAVESNSGIGYQVTVNKEVAALFDEGIAPATLRRLQALHDDILRTQGAQDFENGLINFCADYNLTYPMP